MSVLKNTPTSEGPPEGPFGSFCDSKPEPNPGRAPLGGCVVGGAVLEPPKKGRFGGVPDPKVLPGGLLLQGRPFEWTCFVAL